MQRRQTLTPLQKTVRSFSVDDLEKFAVAVESPSFQEAAQAAGVTPPAITAAIGRLEQLAGGVKFFDRGRGHEATPTQEAHFLVQSVRRVLDDLEQLESQFEILRSGVRPVRVACYPAHLERAVFPAVDRATESIRLDFSRVRKQRIRGVGRSLAQEVHDRIADISFGPPGDDSVGLERKLLYRTVIRVIGAGENLSPIQIGQTPVFAAPKGFASRKRVDEAFGSVGLSPNVSYEGIVPTTLIRAVAAGYGFALLPDDYDVVRELNAPALVNSDDSEVATDVFAFWRPGSESHLDPLLSAFETL